MACEVVSMAHNFVSKPVPCFMGWSLWIQLKEPLINSRDILRYPCVPYKWSSIIYEIMKYSFVWNTWICLNIFYIHMWCGGNVDQSQLFLIFPKHVPWIHFYWRSWLTFWLSRCEVESHPFQEVINPVLTRLVVSTPLKNISQLGRPFPIYGKQIFETSNQSHVIIYQWAMFHSYVQ